MADNGSESDSDEDGEVYSGMQQPTLMKQLQTILSEYPDDGQILKEIVQNAEDAEASELKILYDGRNVNAEPIKDKKRSFRKYFKGPGLVIYNDAEFSSEDWKGIKTLYSSNKEFDRTKVGKFGLGFKSVFHITDHPLIISGEYLLILDPHQKTNKVCLTLKLAKLDRHRGMQKSDLLNCLSGIFGFGQDVLNNGYYKGTLFRFSLRDTASKLSDNIYSEEKLYDLIRSFKTEASVTLLFLKSIENIQIFAKNSSQFPAVQDGKPIFTVRIIGENKMEVKNERKNFLEKIKQFRKQIPQESISSQYEITIHTRCYERDTFNDSKTVWLVYNLLKGQKMSEQLRLLSQDEGLGYSPYVGIAYPLFLPTGMQFISHVFCFLPLPLEQKSLTGLPIHVNGFFALSQNRRCVKWATADQIANHSHKDKAIQWNEGLISEILPEIYVEVIKLLINKSKTNGNTGRLVSMVTRCIPDIDAVDEKWQSLAKHFCTTLFHQAFLFTMNNGGQWIKADQAVFAECRNSDNSKIMCDSDVEKTLLKLLKQYKQNLVEVPSHVRSMIEREVSSPQYITPRYMCDLLKTSKLYTSLTMEEKLHVLWFILENGHYKLLDGLELLPLHSGDFTQFIPRQSLCQSKIYYCFSSDDIKMFPGIEQQFVATKLSPKFYSHFKEMTQQGLYQIFPFYPSDFGILIAKSIEATKVKDPSRIEKWLQIVWTYLKQNFTSLKDQFKNITLLPALIYPDKKLNLYKLSGFYILRSYGGMQDLPNGVCRCLRNLSITVLQSLPDYVIAHPTVMKQLVHYPNSDSVLQLLTKLIDTGPVSSIVSQFNEKNTEDDKQSFLEYIQNCNISGRSSSILHQMNLFIGSHSTKKVSVSHIPLMAPITGIPVPYPKEVLLCENPNQRKLAKILGATEMTLSSLICEILHQLANSSQTVYSPEQKQKLMSFVKENLQTDHSVMQKAKEVSFVLNEDGKEYKPNELIDGENNTLRNLFPDKSKFPSGKFCTPEGMSFLRKLDMRTIDCLTASDIAESAFYLHKHSHNKNFEKSLKQSKAIMTVLKDKTHLLEQKYGKLCKTLSSVLCELKIVSTKVPPHDYPKMLNWYGKRSAFYKPSEVYEGKYYKLVGSVSALLPDDISEVLSSSFKINQPPLSLVLQQLDLIAQKYQSKYKPELLPLIKEIYTYLAEFADECDELRSKKLIWTGNGFCFPNMVYVTRKKSDIALKPYLYPLSSDLEDVPHIKLLFEKLGSRNCQNLDTFKDVQKLIREKYAKECSQGTTERKHDLQLVIKILNCMKDMRDEPSFFDEPALVPIHTDDSKLILKPVTECRYSNADWLKDISIEEGEDIFFVHPDVPHDTAILLGVQSLTDDLLSDAEGFEEWGQKEPLTRRIKNILNDYADGFSVPKEIVQNADDAGASKVCFIYDERENEDAKVRLLDENMSSCQGPAFWAYNNAQFTKEDLQNITKLSGATKQDDLKKIGKFGLGFCSVYNLTDIPSFITGDQIVIFDPHAKYLGKAVTTSNPGLKINLNSLKNQTMIKRLKNQFKPFNGICGCDLTMEDGIKPFKGSLFRFPLRTKRQACESDICSKPYGKKEMKELLNLFMESAGNILLFTQNVSEIELYHIPDSAQSPDESILIYAVKRNVSGKVSCSDSHIQQPDPISNITVVRDLSASIEKSRKFQQRDFEKVSLCVQVDIEIKVEKKARKKFGQNPRHVKASWLVSWASGTGTSKNFVFQPQMKKALPLASVASLIVKNSKGIRLKPLQNSPYGFYKESHFFCYLPLPVQCPLPVHINASFAVTANRRQLSSATIDDKDSLESRWNEALMGDAVCNAYILLLESLQKMDYESDNIYMYSEIWPILKGAKEYSGNLKTLQEAFYNKVIQENPVIFRRSNIRKPYSNCIFLEPSLMNSEVGQDIFSAAVHFKENSNVTVMTLHETVKTCFEKAGCMDNLSGKILTFDLFYKEVFFPNITSNYWDDKIETRDRLIHYALSHSTTCLDNQIRTTSCIPSEPNGRLKKPTELIDPESHLINLFSIEEEWFISNQACQGKFKDKTVLKKLKSLGLITQYLPNDVVINRVQSVGALARNCSNCGLKRCRSVLTYLTEHVKFGDGKSVLTQISNIKFLPVKQKPETWEFYWGGDAVYQNTMETSSHCDIHALYTERAVIYEKPSLLYSTKAENLVFCQKFILEESVIHEPVSSLLADIGVIGANEKGIPVQAVAKNLQCICRLDTTKLSTEAQELLSKICTDIYRYFDFKLADIDDSLRNDILVTLKGLKKYPVILLNDQFLSPERVAFYLEIDCSPCIYGINNNSLCHRKDFLQSVGVKERFKFQDLLYIILEEQEKTNRKLSKSQLSLFCKLLNVLSDSMIDESITADGLKAACGNRILVPDENRMLKPIDDLCMDDSKNIRRSKTMTFVNEKISLEIASRLGIKSKKRKQLKDHSRRLPFGQKEELTTRLKRLLSGYPCDEGILKELIQNADDAGAKEIHIIKDFKQHPSSHVFDKWEPLQGPALLVYNDSSFSEADIEGIQKLGVGSKGDDPTKTGQFGVGFNAVYHLTDVPSFLTRGPEVESGETLCVLDPHRLYVEEAEEDSPGMQYIDLEDIKDTYPDVFGCYYEQELLKEKGTVFRLPLRSENMAKTSSIKNDPITPDIVNILLDQFKKEMMKMLLFVKNVEKIRISDITTGKLIEEYTVEVCISDKDKKKRNEFMGYVKQVSRKLNETKELKDINAKEVNYVIHVKDNRRTKHRWLVIQQIGLKETKDGISDTVLTAYREGRNGMLPIGGVAVPMKYSNEHFSAFCFLPLPCLTGLPVIINGHFDLDHETRRRLWTSDKTDNRVLWNETLIKNVISPVYVRAVQLFKAELCLNNHGNGTIMNESKLKLALFEYHSIFPDFRKASENYWKFLASAFYKQVVENEEDVFVSFYRMSDEKNNCSISFYPLISERCTFVSLFDDLLNQVTTKLTNSLYYSPLSSKEDIEKSEILKQTCKILGMKLLDSPLTLYDNLKHAKVEQAALLTPDHMIEFLKSFADDRIPDRCVLHGLNEAVTQTTFLQERNVIACLFYCKMSENFQDQVEGLPLCLTNDEVLHKFSSENPVYCTKYCDIFPKSSRLFLSSKLIKFFGCQFDTFVGMRGLFSSSIFRLFDMNNLVECLSETLEPGLYQQNHPIQWQTDRFPDVTWMKRFWKLICNLVIPKIKTMPYNQEKDDCLLGLLDRLSKWCILPCKRSQIGIVFGAFSKELMPISDHEMVVFKSSFSKNMMDTLTHLNLPEIDPDCVDEEAYNLITNHLVARQDKPLVLLNCLYHHRKVMNNLTEFQSNAISEYLAENLCEIKNLNSEDTKMKLKHLPIHVTIQGTPTDLANQQKVLLLPKGMPLHGMNDWGLKSGILLLKSNEKIKPLYDFLQFSESSHCDVYTNHIFKHFNFLSQSDQIFHLCYIRDKLLTPLYGTVDQIERLIEELKILPFVWTERGEVFAASKFYSPYTDVFAVMGSFLNFPPKPFCNPEWKVFMEKAGMITTVTQEMYMSFILQVEKEGIHSVNIEKKSRTLVKHLFKMTDLDWVYLQSIAAVKFIVPQHVPEFLMAVHKQCNIDRLICFSESVLNDHRILIWTNCSLLPEWAKPPNNHLMQKLNVCDSPCLEKVVQHVQNVCDSMQDNLEKEGNYWNKDDIQELMTDLYKYLHRRALEDENEKQIIKQCLDSKPLVYLPEHRRMIKCSSVVKEMDSRDIIKPFLYPLPDEFVPYFKLFEFLGTNRKIACDNYARVLENLSVDLDGKEMHLNELQIVKTVIEKLFCLIPFHISEISQGQDFLKVKVLYLPSREHVLVNSTKLIYSDYKSFEEFMTKENLLYFIGFKELGIHFPRGQDYIKMLPECYRPKCLSQMIQFSVNTNSLEYANDDKGRQLQEFIQTHEFIESILRLVHHENNRIDHIKGPKLEIDDSKIRLQLQSITIQQVLPFEREWKFNGQVIRTEPISCYFEEKMEGQKKRWFFYFSIDSNDWIQQIDHKFATMLNKCIGFLLQESTCHVFKILSTMNRPQFLQKLLDDLDISEYSMGESPVATVFPPAGTIVHPKWHFLLDNNFTEFEIDEYVALQLADDEIPDENESETGQVYMFAIVKGRKDTDSSFASDSLLSSVFQIYILEIGSGQKREIPAFKIYKLNRSTESKYGKIMHVGHASGQESSSRSLEDVFKEIRQILKSVWKMPKIEKKYIIKRLLRKWHPDKNYGNEKFATKVFQYIKWCIQRLENNESIDNVSGNSHSTSRRRPNSTYEAWFNDVDRTCKRDGYYQQKAQQDRSYRDYSYAGSDSDSSSSGDYSFAGSHSYFSRTDETPLPQEAKRWFKQACLDLSAAKKFSPAAEDIQAHNWICYNCHQAAEKAMKAVWYGKNANRVTKSHDLRNIASGLGPKIQDLANSLDKLVGNHLYMRYPDILKMPKIPSDMFNASVSSRAIEITQELCAEVKSILP